MTTHDAGAAGTGLSQLAELDATGQAELVRRGEVSPLELVDAAIERIERVNPRLNAVVVPLFEDARNRATAPDLPRGAFHGVPMLFKDDRTAAMKGAPLYEGMSFLRDLGWVERYDSFLVTKILEAGFVPLGRSNLPELAIIITTEPASFGPTRNPWDVTRSVGGSSGGSAAAVAAGLVPVAHGSDAGGSIRIPASMCGVVGLKPSRGRVSQGPEAADLWGYGPWVANVLTRSVRDTAGVLDVVSGSMVGDPHSAPPPLRPFSSEVGVSPGSLRVGFMTRTPVGAAPLHPDCREAVTEAARLLEALGHRVEEAHPADLDTQPEPSSADSILRMAGAAVSWELSEWSRRTGREIGEGDVEPYTWAFAELGRSLSAERFLTGLATLQARTRRLAAWWSDGFDVLLTPTLAVPPFELGFLAAPEDDPLSALYRAASIAPFCGPFNLTGQPAISLPLHWNGADLPIGVQLVGAHGAEAMLLRLASQLESARPWVDRRPKISA